ncbi:MAG: hypothetical protein KAX49_11770 [Halanaerobiales bacterium]|nr:hypothetical protein [Halanaerobiales bacterium]
MKGIKDIWNNIKDNSNTKIRYFDYPEDAIEFITKWILKDIDTNIKILDSCDEEISLQKMIIILNKYKNSLEPIPLHFSFEIDNEKVNMYLENWGLTSDCDTYMDILTLSMDTK